MQRFAFVFPGPGFSVGGHDGAVRIAARGARQIFSAASAILGQDLWELVAGGPAEELNKTVNTQPVMLTAGYALLQAWRGAGGPEPALVAGHSLGEYAALVAGGVLAFEDALPLVRYRAQAMQEAVPEGHGGIAAILGLDEAGIARRMRRCGTRPGAGGSELQCARPGRDCGPARGGAAGDGARQGQGRQARSASAHERTVALQLDARKPPGVWPSGSRAYPCSRRARPCSTTSM